MDQVHRMAYKTVSTGLNAGDGYGEVWIRDFNTFIQVAMDVMPDKNVQDCLNTFFHFQGAEGDIVDGYIDIRKADLNNVGGYKYRLSKTCPQFAAHKIPWKQTMRLHSFRPYTSISGKAEIRII